MAVEGILLEIREIKAITKAGTTLLRGIGMNTRVALSTTTMVPTRRLVASSGVCQRG